MEAAASVLTLLQAATILVNVARELSRKLRNAPEELHALTAQLLLIQYELERIKQASDTARSDLMTDEVRRGVCDAFIQARSGLSELDTVVSRAQGNIQIKDRIKWLRKEHQSAEAALAKIKAAREHLLLLMQVISW